ncbi:GATA zinc finger domain-containing protein 14-like [Vespa velutina]|uniref:GATA zinc finger domain-containing protein 14-like n=1 Tax=Vespa velutina TaxID=202808 RepID=UPI001FB4A78A|nr:GATA zinc finger domain-containing protein 14-like [Vespa velutina]
MENSFRIIYAFSIIFIRFPLYYLHPLENTSVTYDIKNLCDNPIKDFFRNESKYKTNCSVNYSKEINQLKVTETNIEIFVCLRTYEIINKTCTIGKQKELVNIIHDKKKLDLMIQNLTETNFNDLDMNNHCLSLSEFLPTNTELQSPLETLRESLNDTFVCKKVCFDLYKKMIPLCAILELINKIDKEIVNHIKMNYINVKVDAINENISSLKKTKENQINHRNQSSLHQDETTNNVKTVKPLKKGIEMKTILSNNSSNISNISMNNVNDNDTNNNGNLKYMSDQQNKGVKSKSNVNEVNLQSISASTNVYNQELYKTPSQLDDIDKKQSININNSQEPPPNIEKADPKSKKEDKIDLEVKSENPEINSSLQNKQSDTKTTVPSNNTPIIENVESSTQINDEQQSNLPDSTDQSINEDNLSDKTRTQKGNYSNIKNDDESHFLTYFAIISLGFIAGYIGYHNKQKILAIVLEGRRSKNNRGRRRPSTANYRKLDCTLEEAVTSQCNANVTHVMY